MQYCSTLKTCYSLCCSNPQNTSSSQNTFLHREMNIHSASFSHQREMREEDMECRLTTDNTVSAYMGKSPLVLHMQTKSCVLLHKYRNSEKKTSEVIWDIFLVYVKTTVTIIQTYGLFWVFLTKAKINRDPLVIPASITGMYLWHVWSVGILLYRYLQPSAFWSKYICNFSIS